MTKSDTITAFSLARIITEHITEALQDAEKYNGHLMSLGDEVVVNGSVYNYHVGRSDLTNDVSPWAVFALTSENKCDCSRLAHKIEKLINIGNIA